MAINKVVYGDTTLIDISDTTATNADVLNTKYFYTNAGTKVIGTATLATATVSSTTLTLTDGFPVSSYLGDAYGIDYHQYLTAYRDAQCTEHVSAAHEGETIYVKCTKSSGYSSVLYGKRGYVQQNIGSMANNEVKSVTMLDGQVYFSTMDI